MSEPIDDRVVQMRFNNRQFEDGVRTSIKSIDNLKKGLDLSGSVKNLSNFQRTANNISMAGMLAGIDAISNKFTTLGIMGVTTIQNITNSALNAGKRMISALTIDPVTTGFDEYETKMNSIKTILSNTKAKGTTLDDVNIALGELNAYSDKTIYNFAQMTDMVGKFSAKTGDLKSSVNTVKGLANLAAEAGVDNTRLQGALYQISQMAETVKSMDWMSMDTAGLSTIKFRKDLIDMAKAMGTIDLKTLKDLENGTVSFRETLEKDWLTKGVFNAVTASYALNDAMTAAAGEVTTFTKLIDVMKESVQSGWAVTWEKIIGDKDTSAKMFTAINDAFGSVIGKSADARNAILEFWNVNGGRKDFILGIANALMAMGAVLKPLEDAFTKVFPPITGQNLLDISKAFKDLMGWLIITDGTSDKIKRTFQGLFSIIDIGKMIVVSFIGALSKVLGISTPIGDVFLSITARIGDFLTAINSIYKKFGAFNPKMITEIGDLFIKSFYISISTSLSKTSESFKNFAKVLKDSGSGIIGVILGLSAKIDDIKQRFMYLISTFKSIKTLTETYTESIKKITNQNVKMEESMSGTNTIVSTLTEKLRELGSYIKTNLLITVNFLGKVFGRVRDEISNSIKDITFQEVVSAIQAFITGSLFLSLRKLAKVLSENIPKLTDGVVNTLDSVRSSLKAYQNEVKSKILLNIAVALAIMTASIYALSQIDSEKMKLSLTALTTMFVQLMAGFYGFTKIVDGKTYASMIPLATIMIALSISVSILAGAMKKLADLDWSGVGKGLTVVTILLAEMMVVAKVLSNQTVNLTSASLAMIGIALSIGILVNAVAKAGLLPYDQLKTGLIAVGLALASVAMLAKSTAGTDLLTSAAGILVIAVALNILTGAIAILGNMDKNTLSQGLTSVGLALAGLTVAMMLIPPNLGSSALGVLAIAMALNVMVSAIAIFGNMNIETIKQGILTIASMLTVLVVAMNLLRGSISSAVAVGVLAASLTLLIIPITILGNMPLAVLATGILAMAAALLVLGGVSYILAPVAPIMISISSAIGLLGLGLGLVALSVGVFAAGLVLLAGAIGTVLLAIPAIGEAIRAFIGEINKSIPMLSDTIGLLLQLVINQIPRIKLVVQKILDMLIELIIEYAPKVVDGFIRLMNGVIVVILNQTKPISDALANVIISMIDSISGMYDKLKEAGCQVIAGIINGITSSIKEVVKIGSNLANALTTSVKGALGIHSPSKIFTTIGENLSKSLGLGVKNEEKKAVTAATDLGNKTGTATGASISKTAKEAAKGSGEAAKEAAKSAFDISMAWIEKQKYYKLLSLEDELKAYEKMTERYKAGAEEREKIDREIFRVKNELVERDFNSSKKWIDEKKYYNQLSLREELAAQERILAKYSDNAEKRKEIEKEMFKLKRDIEKADADYFAEWINEQNAEKQRLSKDAYDKDISLMEQKKYYNQLSLNEELAILTKLQQKTDLVGEDRKRVERDVYRIKEELRKTDEDYLKNVQQVEKESNDKRIKMEEEYYAKTKEINEKLKQDVNSLTKTYTDALDSRSNSLYRSFGLFDEVKPKDDIKGTDLIKNLSDQVAEFETWQQNINALSSKGIDTGLIKELSDMGPKSLSEIKALNSMSSSELDGYVYMWKTKHNDARFQAVLELEGMRKDTISKIEEITKESDIKLKEYNATWSADMELLKTETDTHLETLKINWISKVGSISSETEKEMNIMTKNIQTTIKSPDWSGLGANIINGIKTGVQSKAQELAQQTAQVAYQALQAAKDALGIQSPSRAFAEVGRYSMDGFVVGIKNYSGNVISAVSNVGTTTIDSLKGVMSMMSDVLTGDIDLSPVIRPVLDLSDIMAGGQAINGMLSKSNTIDLTTTTNNIPKVTTEVDRVQSSQNGSNQQGASIQFTQINQSPKALSRLDIYRQTKNQISVMKGLVTST